MSRQSGSVVEFARGSDAGRVRPSNEDVVLADQEIGLAIVADGLGNYHAGEIASRLAVDVIREFVSRGLRTAGRVAPSGSTRGSMLLRDALARANEVVYDRAKSQPLYEGMGAVVVAALFYAGRVAIAHAGDARAYRMRHGQFEQLTRDHVPMRAAAGLRQPGRFPVTRALGAKPSVMVDLLDGPRDPGDFYLLCSDGLSAMIPDPDIRLTLEIFGDNLDTVTKQLIKLANDNGGRDNVSVVVARQRAGLEQRSRGLWRRVTGWFP